MMRTPFIPLIVATVILLLSAGLYGFGYHSLTGSAEMLAKLETDIQTKSSGLDQIARARAALATLSNDEEVIRQYSVGKEEIVPFLESLQTTGKPFGAVVNVLSVSDERTSTRSRVTLSLSITGSFDAVMRTLGTIENGSYDGVLTNLTLDSAGGDVKGVKQWTAASVLSIGLRPVATTTPKKP